jgi:hypothetical protein
MAARELAVFRLHFNKIGEMHVVVAIDFGEKRDDQKISTYQEQLKQG